MIAGLPKVIHPYAIDDFAVASDEIAIAEVRDLQSLNAIRPLVQRDNNWKQQPIKNPMTSRQRNFIVTGRKANQLILRLPFSFLTFHKAVANEKILTNNLMQ